MSKASVSYADIKANLLKDPEVKTEYDALEPRYQAIRQIIQARNDLHITQAELAKRIGTRVIQKVLYHVMPEERMNLRTRKRWHI